MNRSPDTIIALIFFLMGLLVLLLAIWQILFCIRGRDAQRFAGQSLYSGGADCGHHYFADYLD